MFYFIVLDIFSNIIFNQFYLFAISIFVVWWDRSIFQHRFGYVLFYFFRNIFFYLLLLVCKFNLLGLVEWNYNSTWLWFRFMLSFQKYFLIFSQIFYLFAITIFGVWWNGAIIQHGFDYVLFYGQICATACTLIPNLFPTARMQIKFDQNTNNFGRITCLNFHFFVCFGNENTQLDFFFSASCVSVFQEEVCLVVKNFDHIHQQCLWLQSKDNCACLSSNKEGDKS